MELVFYALLVIVALSGALIGRRWALLIPSVAWPAYFLGLGNGWWGYGLGDGWQFGFLLVMAISLVAVAIGVGIRRMPRGHARPSGNLRRRGAPTRLRRYPRSSRKLSTRFFSSVAALSS